MSYHDQRIADYYTYDSVKKMMAMLLSAVQYHTCRGSLLVLSLASLPRAHAQGVKQLVCLSSVVVTKIA